MECRKTILEAPAYTVLKPPGVMHTKDVPGPTAAGLRLQLYSILSQHLRDKGETAAYLYRVAAFVMGLC